MATRIKTRTRKKSDAAGTVAKATAAVVGVLVVDDATVVGVADDIAIPPVLLTGLVLTGIAGIYDAIVNSDEVNENSQRNPAQDKPLTKGEIEKLKQNGWDHSDKGKSGGKTDLYKDRDGNIYQKAKGGKGEGEPIGMNIKDLK